MLNNYGSPFVNLNSGRVKSDRLNERNLEAVLDNYINSPYADLKQFRWSVTKEQSKKAFFLFPAVGFVVPIVLGRSEWSAR